MRAYSNGNTCNRIREAEEYLSEDTYSTQTKLRNQLDPQARVLCIGPAGENLSRLAVILSETGFASGKSGFGGVMGSKKLKAIAVRGTKPLSIFDPKRLIEISKKVKEVKMGKVKILGICASTRRGNTEFCVKEALKAAKEFDIVETEFVHFKDYKINPCTGCFKCFNPKEVKPDRLCQTWNDGTDKLLLKMIQADGVIFGTPVWYFSISSKLKNFFDRMEAVNVYSATYAKNLVNPYQVVGAIAVGANRNGGQEQAILDIIRTNLFDKICVGSFAGPTPGCYFGGAVVLWPERSSEFINPNWAEISKKDELGLKSVRAVGRRVADVSRIIKAGLKAL